MTIQSDNYLIDQGLRQQTDFLGTQAEYVTATNAAVERMCNEIRARLANPSLFFYCCDEFAACRRAIAKNNDSEGKEAFGLSRHNTLDARDGWFVTSLLDAYSRYNTQFSLRVQDLTESLEKGDTKLESRPIPSDFILQAMRKAIHFPEDALKRCNGNPCVIEKTKKTYPELYQNVMLAYALRAIFANPEVSEYKLYTLSMKMKDPSAQKVQWVALSQFILERSRDPSTPPQVHLLHQDPFLIEVTMKKAQELFNQALKWEGLNVAELQKIVGTLFFCLSHAMPWKRGSSAIIEMLQAVIYRYHGFHAMQEPSDTSLNLEALTALSLEDFLEVYQNKMPLSAKKIASTYPSARWLCVAAMAVCLGFLRAI